MWKIQTYKLTILLSALVVLSSCVKRVFEPRPAEGNFTIAIDWSKTSPALRPAKIKLYFYGSTGAVIVRESDNINAYSGTLPIGEYKVLIFDDSDSRVDVADRTSFGGATAYAKVMDLTRAGGLEVIHQPDAFHAAVLTELEVLQKQQVSATTPAKDYISRIELDLTLSGETSSITQCSVYIDGIAQGIRLATGEVVANPTKNMVLKQDLTSTGYKTSINVFGRDPQTTNTMTLAMNFEGGGRQEIVQDITEAIRNINNPETQQVVIKPNVEVTKKNDGSFSATLTGWSYKEEQITVENKR